MSAARAAGCCQLLCCVVCSVMRFRVPPHLPRPSTHVSNTLFVLTSLGSATLSQHISSKPVYVFPVTDDVSSARNSCINTAARLRRRPQRRHRALLRSSVAPFHLGRRQKAKVLFLCAAFTKIFARRQEKSREKVHKNQMFHSTGLTQKKKKNKRRVI